MASSGGTGGEKLESHLTLFLKLVTESWARGFFEKLIFMTYSFIRK
jgi:hypothetical protein